MKITYDLALDPGADIFESLPIKRRCYRNVVINRNGRIVYLTRLL